MVRKTLLKIIALVLVFVSATFFFIGVSFADNTAQTSMSVSPMSQKISLIPGEKYEGAITVANVEKATKDLTYTAKVGPYNRNRNENNLDDYGMVDVETKTGRNIMMDWIKLDKSEGILSPGSSEVINYVIDVPEDVPAGAQYASILIMDVPEEDDKALNDGGAIIQSRTQLVAAIFANIAGETIENGSIYDEYVPSFLLNSPLETTSMVRNEGNVYTDAEYILQVWPLFSDEEICTNEEDPNTELVLPDTERYHAETCNLPSIGIFKARQTVRIFNKESVVEKMIIVCPIWLLFVIFFVIAGLIIWIVMRVRARGKNNKKSEKKSEE